MELKHLDKKTREFVEDLIASNAPPIYKLPVGEARKVLEELQSGSRTEISCQIDDQIIPAGPDQKISIRIIKPLNTNERLPVLMYFHGGGWILGSKNTHDRLIREFATGANCAVVFVNYSPSPEATYPKPIEEAFAATQYIAQNASQFNLDANRIGVAGDSVGGNMAAVVAILAHERGLKLDCQLLFYPVTDAGFNTESFKVYAEGPWLTRPAMEWFWDAYEPNKSERKKYTRSPLQASTEQLEGLPPTLVIVAENDVLRDEGEAYAHKLMDAGVEVTSVRCLGTIHDFMMLNPLSKTNAVRGAIDFAINYLKKNLLRQKAMQY